MNKLFSLIKLIIIFKSNEKIKEFTTFLAHFQLSFINTKKK